MKLRLAALLAMTLLSACRHAGDITSDNGGGIYAVRSSCPIAGVPAGTGDVTLFNPADSTDSPGDRRDRRDHRRPRDVPGRRRRRRFDRDLHRRRACAATPGPARQVVLPYFDVALRGGATVAAKQVGQRGDQFRRRATSTAGRGSRRPSASTAAPQPCRPMSATILTRPRKAGEAEAAIDPLADPAIRSAVANATFEHLVGFQLTQTSSSTTRRAKLAELR